MDGGRLQSRPRLLRTGKFLSAADGLAQWCETEDVSNFSRLLRPGHSGSVDEGGFGDLHYSLPKLSKLAFREP
jgi:hypothetical protein